MSGRNAKPQAIKQKNEVAEAVLNKAGMEQSSFSKWTISNRPTDGLLKP